MNKIKKVMFLALFFFVVATLGCAQKPSNTYMQLAILYQMRAAETKALYFQAYNMAKLSLDASLSEYRGNKKKAVVVDIDETILDNSPYQVKMLFLGKSYSRESWNKWCRLAQAKALPGALDFLKYASSKGIDIFYVSNRKIENLLCTMRNLKKLEFPQVIKEHFYLKVGLSSKESRRKSILKTHEILILCGDNLSDFSGLFDGAAPQKRDELVFKFRKLFGKKFIVFPNPMYGNFEAAIYGYRKNLSSYAKEKLRLKAIKCY